MTSRDQSYKMGETKGRTEEKTNQMLANLGEKAQAAKEKTQEGVGATTGVASGMGQSLKESAQAAKDKAQQSALAAKDKTQDTTGVAEDRASQMGQSTKESAQAGKDNTGGFLQQAGEKVKGVAQGATEAVKNTLGIGHNDEDKEHYPNHNPRDY